MPVLWDPLAALLPLHEPPAVQDDGLLVTLQLIVAVPPVVMLAGATEILTTGIAITVTVADADPEPAALLQLRVYVRVPAVAIAPVLWDPLALLLPLHALLAVHDEGLLVALQLIVELLPVPMLVGLALIETTGGLEDVPLVAVTLVVALSLPPALLHSNV